MKLTVDVYCGAEEFIYISICMHISVSCRENSTGLVELSIDTLSMNIYPAIINMYYSLPVCKWGPE